MADEQRVEEQDYFAGEPADETVSFYAAFRELHRETTDSIGGDGQVDEPREYRFDVEFPDRRYAFQGYPDENRVFVGQYLGDSGVIWFDELRYDLLHHGWKTVQCSAWDLAQSLIDKRSLTYDEAYSKAAAEPQSTHKESPTSVEAHADRRREAHKPQTRVERVAHGVREGYRRYRRLRESLREVPGPRKLLKRSVQYLREKRHAA